MTTKCHILPKKENNNKINNTKESKNRDENTPRLETHDFNDSVSVGRGRDLR